MRGDTVTSGKPPGHLGLMAITWVSPGSVSRLRRYLPRLARAQLSAEEGLPAAKPGRPVGRLQIIVDDTTPRAS